MSFRAFVNDLQRLQEDATEPDQPVDGGMAVGDNDDNSSPENPTGESKGPGNISEALIAEMAVATAPGVKLTRIKDGKYKDYDLAGFHNISIDGEHAGVIAKWRGQANSYKASGHHYVIKPTLDGHFNTGSWKDLSPEEHAAHIADPNNSPIYSVQQNHEGKLQKYTADTTEADHKFEGHNTHEKQFDTQQEAVDHFARAHRMHKEFPAGPDARYAEAYDVKERYLQADEKNNKAAAVNLHLHKALRAAKEHYPEHTDLHDKISSAMKHDKINHVDTGDYVNRFRDLTYDLPEHRWNSPGEDKHVNIRSIRTPWKL